jgi:hypothetical protein
VAVAFEAANEKTKVIWISITTSYGFTAARSAPSLWSFNTTQLPLWMYTSLTFDSPAPPRPPRFPPPSRAHPPPPLRRSRRPATPATSTSCASYAPARRPWRGR